MQLDLGLTFGEMAMNEPLPKSVIQQAVFDYLQGRNDLALFGAMAVNAYVDERRMTEDVDLLAINAEDFAAELQSHLNTTFHIAVRTRVVQNGLGFRLYQSAKPKNRHLVDLRPVKELPPHQRIDGVLVVTPEELIAGKVVSYCRRKGQPKAGTDWRDLAMLLLKFPTLKVSHGDVRDRLIAKEADQEILMQWEDLVALEIYTEDEDSEFE